MASRVFQEVQTAVGSQHPFNFCYQRQLWLGDRAKDQRADNRIKLIAGKRQRLGIGTGG